MTNYQALFQTEVREPTTPQWKEHTYKVRHPWGCLPLSLYATFGMTLGKCVNFLCLCFFIYEVATMTPNLLVYCKHEVAKEPAPHHFSAFFLHAV